MVFTLFVAILEQQNNKTSMTWENSYCLLLWQKIHRNNFWTNL